MDQFNGYLGAVGNATINADCVARDPHPILNSEVGKPRMREVTITSLDHGFVVRVGCQTLAIQNKEDLIAKLVQYITDPTATEEKYYRGELFK